MKLRKRNFIASAWNDLSPTGKVVVAGAGSFGIYRLVKNLQDDAAAAKQKKELEKLSKEFNQPFIVTSGANQGVVLHVDLAKEANILYGALHSGLFGWFADVPTIVNELLKVPKPYMSSLEYIYKRVYNENLETKVRTALGATYGGSKEWNQVAYLFQ